MARTIEQHASAIRRESDSKIERLVRWIKRNTDIESIGDEALSEWARWSVRGVRVGPGDPSCTLGRVQEQRVAAGQRGGEVEAPPMVEKVEKAVLKLPAGDRKVVDTYYCDYSTMDQKAKDCGMTRSGYWRALRRIQRAIYMEIC